MLKTMAKITMTGESVINDTSICDYSAIIDLKKPENMSVTLLKKNKELYKENRVECREDYAAFEEKAYATQEAVFAILAAKSEQNTPDEMPDNTPVEE